MKPIPPADAIRLGMLIEYLRGISSVSISLTASVEALPELNANFAKNRYRVVDVSAVIRELKETLEAFELRETQSVLSDLGDKLEEMENYLKETPAPEEAFLLDNFANGLIVIANDVGEKILEECAS